VVGITILGSGSRGNAILVHTVREAVLIDAGFSARELERRCAKVGIDPGMVRGVLISHEHRDHVSGLGPVARRLAAPVFCTRLTAEAVRTMLPHPPERIHLFDSSSSFEIGAFRIEPFTIPHDATDPVAFIVQYLDVRFGIATDLGHASTLAKHRLRGCDVLVVESNHDLEMLRNSSRPWQLKQRIMSRHGHLSNEDGVRLVRETLGERTRAVVMAHASRECNTYERVERCIVQCLEEIGRDDVRPLVARQDEPLPTIWL